MTDLIDHIVGELAARNPAAADLAVLASLAARLEPEVIRALRIELLPDTDAAAEADLWFSDLVDMRAATGIMLRGDALAPLRRALVARRGLEAAYGVLARLHPRTALPFVAFEERVTYLGLCGDFRDADAALHEVTAALVEARTADASRYQDLVAGVSAVWTRLPDAVRERIAAWELAFVAGFSPERVPDFDELEIVPRLSADTPTTCIQVAFADGDLRFAHRQDDAPSASAKLITVPASHTLVLALRWGSGRRETVIVPPNGAIGVPCYRESTVEVTSLAGDVYRLSLTAAGDRITEGVNRSRGWHTDVVMACATVPDGRHAVSASLDGTLKVWDLDSGAIVATLAGHVAGVTACTVSPDGQRLVSASEDRTLRVWNLESGLAVATLSGHRRRVFGCAVSSDGRHLVSASEDGTARIWDFATGEFLGALECGAGWVTACVVLPDGRRLATASSDRTLTLWDLDSGRRLATLTGHTEAVTACTVTPDGRRMVSASSDRTLKLWDLDTGHALATLAGHTDVVTACAVTPDGRCAVSASRDGTLGVWDLESHRRIVTHRGDASYTAVTVAVGAIIAGDMAGTVWILDWPEWTTVERRLVIAFFATRSVGGSQLALDEGLAAIERELRLSPNHKKISLQVVFSPGVDDLMRRLHELEPTIIHIRGDHSLGGSILLTSDVGDEQPVSARALARMISASAPAARVVVLDGCFSDDLSEELLSVVDCVIGLRAALSDIAARGFAMRFYSALGNGRSIRNAFDQARAFLDAKGYLRESDPICRFRSIDADQPLLPGPP